MLVAWSVCPLAALRARHPSQRRILLRCMHAHGFAASLLRFADAGDVVLHRAQRKRSGTKHCTTVACRSLVVHACQLHASIGIIMCFPFSQIKTSSINSDGSPLSPILFNFLANCPTRMIRKAHSNWLFSRLVDHIIRNGVAILQYADNTIRKMTLRRPQI